MDPTLVPPKSHKVKGEVNQICLPYEKHFADPSEEETYKLLGELVIHNMGWGYTCFVSAFAVFISEREVKVHKSAVVQYFSNINTVDAFEALKLPIKKVTECEDGTVNKAYEIDLSQPKKIEKAMGINKLDCFPVLWVISNPSKTEWTVKF